MDSEPRRRKFVYSPHVQYFLLSFRAFFFFFFFSRCQLFSVLFSYRIAKIPLVLWFLATFEVQIDRRRSLAMLVLGDCSVLSTVRFSHVADP